MTFNDIFNRNYKELLIVANRITRRKNRNLSTELISETYLQLIIKEYPLDNLEFVKWFSKSMRSLYVWENSPFNNIYRLDVENKLLRQNQYRKPNDIITPRHACLDNLTNEDVKKELDPNIISIFKKSLPLHERYTFELYYEHNLSTRQISKELNYEITYLTINEFVNNIKTKIKKYQWEHD